MLKLHVEVTVLNPEKKKKATAAWVVFEGKDVRGAGRITNDPKALIATSAGRTFAAELHAAHGKLVNPTSIPVGAPPAEKPAKVAKGNKAEANGEAAPDAKPVKKGKAKKAEANGPAEAAPETAAAPADVATPEDKPAKQAKGKKTEADTATGAVEKPAKQAKGKKAEAANGEHVNGEAKKPATKAKAAKAAKAEMPAKPAKAAKKSKTVAAAEA